jgi:hypothetical protein
MLRQASCQAIKEVGRPLTAHEIEAWIAQNDPPLSQQLSSKCYDYVRIILSLSPVDLIIKYKPSDRSLGIDVRSTFYGLVGVDYDPSTWNLLNVKHRKCTISERIRTPGSRKSKSPAQPPEPPCQATKICLFQSMPIVPPIREVDQATVSRAWSTLASVLTPNDSFWTEFMEAIDELKAQMETGKSATNVLEDVLKSHGRFAHPLIAEDVAVILSKEAYEKQEAISSPPIFDTWSW